ncbi:MAG: DUF624 domain-containing protein [Lachnospiraceae bacterium]|nr:DUF624 domain-containing protein [Lachnospiraceae bacterium]
MGRLFNLDSPAMVFLSRLADLMILNIIIMIVCIPIITIGPALTAMHYVILKMVRKEEGYLVRPFFTSFKNNFKQATLSWLIVLVFIIIFVIDLNIINNSGLEFASWLRIILIAVGVIAAMTAIYVFPLIARFENSIRGTFKNALFMSILSLPKTATMIVIYILPIALVLLNPQVLPIIFLLGITGPGYLCAMLYSKTFKRFEPEEEVLKDADDWTVNMDEEVK